MLKKRIYGLTDASLMYNKRVQKFVIENRGKIFATDSAFFMWHEHGDLIGVTCVHVDDFLCSGTNIFFQNVIFNYVNILSWKRRKQFFQIPWTKHFKK